MQFRTIAVVAVALLVALSGCSALGGSQADEPSSEGDTESLNENETGANESDNGKTDPDDAAGSNGTEDDANTDDGGANTDDGGANTDDGDDTANAEWTPPEEPNRKDDGGLEDKREDRIESVEFVDREPAESGEGYSNFNLEVVANTSMENVDPPEHGDVIGEPYFFVKINEDKQKLIERTGEVRMEENGTYHIDVRPDGIEEFGAGPLTVEVFLMDEDKDWDDIYDSVGKTVEYNPETETDNSAADDGNSDDSAVDDADSNDSETSEN